MIPYSNESGLRDYRAQVQHELAPRWPWLLVVLVVVGVVVACVRAAR